MPIWNTTTSRLPWISFALTSALLVGGAGCLGATGKCEPGAACAEGTRTASSTDVIESALTGGDTIAVGIDHTCALLADTGDVRCWGYGFYGSLGYGNTSDVGDNELPSTLGTVNVGGVVTQIALGSRQTCALLDTGAVRCWGDGGSGKLGYGNSNRIGDNEAPATAGDVNVGGTVVQIAAGDHHTCALLDTGAVRCWGAGLDGRLGYGNSATIGDGEAPATAGNVNVGGTAVQITAGLDHTCALLDTGAVRCWGRNDKGQLGYGNTVTIGDNETPASAGDVNVGGSVTQIDAGASFTCALLDTGAVRCWGNNTNGQLGYGNTVTIGDNETPASAGDVSVDGLVTQISVFGTSTCALLAGGYLRCWGNGSGGKLGYGNLGSNIGNDEHPSDMDPVDVGDAVVELALGGGGHICAMLAGGGARCWGGGFNGQLGYGNTNAIGDNEVPDDVGTVPYR